MATLTEDERRIAAELGLDEAEVLARKNAILSGQTPPPLRTPVEAAFELTPDELQIANERGLDPVAVQQRKQQLVARQRRTPLEAAGEAAVGAATEAGQGLLAGFVDEALAVPMATYGKVAPAWAGGAPSGTSWADLYRGIRDQIREQGEQFREEHPVAATTARIAGSVLPLSKAAQATGAGTRSVRDVAKMGAIGGAYGAGEYLGESNVLDYLTDEDPTGASFDPASFALQTGVSAALPPALEGAGRLARAGGGALIDMLRPERVVDYPAELLRTATTRAGLSADDLTRRSMEMGPEASFVDVTGDIGVTSAQAARGVGPMETARVMEDNLRKTKGAKNRLRETLEDATGHGQFEYYSNLNNLIESRRNVAQEMYGEALDRTPFRPTAKFVQIVENSPTVREAWKNLQRQYAQRGQRAPDLYELDMDGGVVSRPLENARIVQELKWELDAMANSMRGSTDAAGKNAYRNLMKDLRAFKDEIYSISPALRQADRMYAGQSAMIGSQQEGIKDGLNRLNVEEQVEKIKNMSPSEKEAYGTGIMANLYDRMGRNREEVLGQLTALDSENAQTVLRLLFGVEGADALKRQLRSERRYREVDTALRQGSQTDPRRVAAAELEAAVSPTNAMARRLADEGPVGVAAERLIDLLTRRTGAMRPEQLTEYADLLTRPGGVEAVVERMQAANVPPSRIQEFVEAARAFQLRPADVARGGLMGAPAAATEND